MHSALFSERRWLPLMGMRCYRRPSSSNMAPVARKTPSQRQAWVLHVMAGSRAFCPEQQIAKCVSCVRCARWGTEQCAGTVPEDKQKQLVHSHMQAGLRCGVRLPNRAGQATSNRYSQEVSTPQATRGTAGRNEICPTDFRVWALGFRFQRLPPRVHPPANTQPAAQMSTAGP